MKGRSALSIPLPLLASAVSMWLALETGSRPWSAAAVLFGLLAGATAFKALRRQRANASSTPHPGYLPRLALFALVALLVMSAGVTLWLSYDRAMSMVHPRKNLPDRTPQDAGIHTYQVVQFPASDGLELSGWYFPAQIDPNGSAVVLVHGNGSNRAQMLDDAALLLAHGYSALVYDSRNCGESQGDANTFGLLEVNDVRGAVDFVSSQPGVNPDWVGLLGHSMGGATVVMAAAQIPGVGAVVAQSAYASLEETIQTSFQDLTGLPPFPFAPLVVYFGQKEAGQDITQVRPVESIAAISPRPALLIHGEMDEMIPVANAHKLFEAAGEPKSLYIIPGAGHCCLLLDGGSEYIRQVISFFDQHLAAE